MEKIKEELNNLINLHNKKIDIEKLTKNIEEKKKELEKLDNKVKLQIDVQLKNIAQKELETAQKEFEKMQKDKKTLQEELSKKFENYKKSLELVVDEELKKYKTKSQLDDLKSLKDNYEKNANDAEKTVKRLINDLTEGKDIDESTLVDAKNKVNVNRELATEIQKEIEKKLKNYTEIESDVELYSDLTYLKLRLQTLSLEQLNEDTEKDFYEKYFKVIEKPELTEEKQKIIDENPVYALIVDMDVLTDYCIKLINTLKKIIELEKNGNDKEIDKESKKVDEYIKKIIEYQNEIEQNSKNVKITEKEEIILFNLKQNEEKRYIDEINKLNEELKSVKFRTLESTKIKPNEIDNNNEKDGRKIVEEYFSLVEKKAEMFKELIENAEKVLLGKQQNDLEMLKLYLPKEDEYKKSVIELKNQLFEMTEKVKPYLNEEDKNKIAEYKNKEKEDYENYKKIKEKEKALEKKAEPKESELTKPNNEENQKDINNLHFYTDLKKLKEIELIITYTLDGNDEKYDKINYKESNKWETIREKLKNVYPGINFESEEGQQELKKYENADPNFVKILSNNKNRLEEYIALLNGEKQIDVNNKDALKITYDIRTLSKSELSKEEKKALEDYAFKHRNIAEVKKTALQSIKFKFREMKEKRQNKKAVKALKSGKIVTSPVKDGILSETKDAIANAIENKHKQQEDAKKAQERYEEYNKNILLYQEKLKSKNILEDKIAKAQTDEERKVYEEELEKIEKDIKALRIGSHSKPTEEQTEPEKPKTDNKQEDVSKKSLDKFEEIAKKQNDEFLENTSNWKDTLKVPETPKPIQTKPQEQEKTPEPTINEETRKDEDLDNDEIEYLKWLDLRMEARKKEESVSQNDDKKKKAYSSYVITSDEKMAKSMEKILNESIDVKKDIVKGIKQHKKSLKDKIASMPEGRNKKIYSEAIEIMDKNIQELESIISDDIKKLGEKPDKREDR